MTKRASAASAGKASKQRRNNAKQEFMQDVHAVAVLSLNLLILTETVTPLAAMLANAGRTKELMELLANKIEEVSNAKKAAATTDQPPEGTDDAAVPADGLAGEGVGEDSVL